MREVQTSVPVKVLYREYIDQECSEWSVFGIKSKKFHNAPPDKGGIDYVAAPEKQGREPRDDCSFLCFFIERNGVKQ